MSGRSGSSFPSGRSCRSITSGRSRSAWSCTGGSPRPRPTRSSRRSWPRPRTASGRCRRRPARWSTWPGCGSAAAGWGWKRSARSGDRCGSVRWPSPRERPFPGPRPTTAPPGRSTCYRSRATWGPACRRGSGRSSRPSSRIPAVRRAPILLILLLASCGNLFTTAAAGVNDRTIEEDRFIRELDFLLADPRFAQQIPQGEEGRAQRQELARPYPTFLVPQTFVDPYPEGHDIVVDEGEIDRLLQQQVTQLGGQPEFDRLLRQSDTDEGDVRRLLERQVIRQRVAEAVVEERLGEEQLRGREGGGP